MAKGDYHMAKNVAKESCCIAPTLHTSRSPLTLPYVYVLCSLRIQFQYYIFSNFCQCDVYILDDNKFYFI
jgi:hypothetical protein